MFAENHSVRSNRATSLRFTNSLVWVGLGLLFLYFLSIAAFLLVMVPAVSAQTNVCRKGDIGNYLYIESPPEQYIQVKGIF